MSRSARSSSILSFKDDFKASSSPLQVFLQILGVIAVSVSVIPWILIPVLPLLLFFLYLRRFFLRTSRNIKRLESTSESLGRTWREG